MAQRRANQSTVRGHLGNARSKVIAMLVAILGEPRSNELLSSSERARREHLGAQRVGLELLDVGLCLTISLRDSIASGDEGKRTARYPLVPAFFNPPVRAVPMAADTGCLPLVPGILPASAVSRTFWTFSVAFWSVSLWNLTEDMVA